MTNVGDKVRLCEAILTLIEEYRTQTRDETLGAEIELAVLDAQFAEIEAEIMADPGAFEPWLVRQRRVN